MNPLIRKRYQVLKQMEKILVMERGSLQAETRPCLRQPGERRGPYYKHQIWEHGQNITCRIAPEKAKGLAEAIAGRKAFEKLAEEFIDATVQLTRRQKS